MNHHKSGISSLLASLRAALAEARHPARLGALGLGALAPLAALGNPTGGQVVGGTATISTPSANGTVINQSSQRAVINWQQFSVGANQYVQFVQPSSSAVVLNRVIGSNPSSIFGNITANGQVFLVNPNGILFAPGATLDVAGLVASTLDVSDADFMQGNYLFSRGSSATPGVVQNQGSIVAGSGGYVVLAGDYVENDGHIDAQSGRVLLAAGGGTTLTLDRNNGLIGYSIDSATLARLAGVSNTGSITADGGTVIMTADVANALTATAVNNQGFVAAHSITSRNGVIVLAAKGGDIDNSGTLDASATDPGVAGGTVILRGNGATKLTPTSVIDAGGDGAKGGFVELSGHTLHVDGRVDPGHSGSLLIDPTTLTINTGTQSHSAGTNPAIGSVGTGFIVNKLNANTNVTLIAGGTIVKGNATAINAAGAGNLALKIGTVVGGTGSLGGSACVGFGVCVTGTQAHVVPSTGGTINLTGLAINIKGALTINEFGNQGSVNLGNVKASAVTIYGGTINLGGNVTASAGKLSISAHHGPPAPAAITVAPGMALTGNSVSLNASGSYGGKIIAGDITATAGGVLARATDTATTPGSGNLTVGNVSGKAASLIASGGTTAKLQTGTVNAPNMSFTATSKKATITTGTLTASSAAGPADITIRATESGGSGAITINGNITVSGKTAATNPNTHPFDLPLAAGLDIENLGSGNGARVVKVNGSITATAHAGAYAADSHQEAGVVSDRKQSGNGGVAGAFIIVAGSGGAASVTGSIAAKGPDAHVGMVARTVSVGNISVTGSGHSITRTIVDSKTNLGGGSYSSHNSAGQATVALGDLPIALPSFSPAPTTTIKAGNITVSGKGVAEAGLFGTHVSAGNISVTATAAKGTRKQSGNVFGALTCTGSNCNSAGFYRGIGRTAMHSGSINGGRAVIGIAARANTGNGSSGGPGVSIKTGALSATGVGLADITLGATGIQTQGLTVVATKGTEKGAGSSQSGVTAVNTFTHTFNINGGQADIRIRSGVSSSLSSGVLTLAGGPVTIGGNVKVTGPAAKVDVKGKTIKIGGTVTVTGSGGSSTEKTVFTPATGTGYTTSFNGSEPTTLNVQGATSGSVSVAGKIAVKAPGLVGVIAVAGAVKLHGFSGSASAVKNYSVLDTRVSPTAVNFTAGSLAVVVSDVGASGGRPVFASGVDTGDMKFSAKGNVDLATRLNVGGNVLVEAVGSIFGTSHGVVAHFNSIDGAHPHANSGSGHGGPKPGVLPASALQANAMAMVAGKGITLTGTQLNIGTGNLSSVHGDSTLLAGLAAEQLAPASANPNGAFIAGGAVTLGGLQLTGSYLLLQGSAVSVLGKVTAPKGTLVQVEPFDLTLPIDIEDSTLLKSALGSAALTDASGPTSFGLTNSSFLSLFPGDTIAVGGTGEAGAVTIGANGPLKLGSTNLIIFTTGNITGLGTVTSTGIVQSLLAFLGPPVPPVTAAEVDPTAGSGTNTGLGDQTDKRKIGGGGDEGGGSQPAGTVSQDSGNASVCH